MFELFSIQSVYYLPNPPNQLIIHLWIIYIKCVPTHQSIQMPFIKKRARRWNKPSPSTTTTTTAAGEKPKRVKYTFLIICFPIKEKEREEQCPPGQGPRIYTITPVHPAPRHFLLNNLISRHLIHPPSSPYHPSTNVCRVAWKEE